jgi:hypothetical protein
MSWSVTILQMIINYFKVFPDNRLAISDFGFAKLKQTVASTMTLGMGTLRWMAPGKLPQFTKVVISYFYSRNDLKEIRQTN